MLAERITPIESNSNLKYQSRRQSRNQSGKKVVIKPGYRFLVKIALVLIVFISINNVVQALLVQRNNEVKQWQDKIQALERESVQIRMEMAGLESFERIQAIAQKEFGMKVAGPKDYQCIAAAPVIKQNIPHLVNGLTEPASKDNNPWARLTAWLGGLGETMASTP